MKFKFDNEKIFASAAKLGISVKTNSSNPGIFYEEQGCKKELMMEDLFTPNHQPKHLEQYTFENFSFEYDPSSSIIIGNIKKTFSKNETVRAA